MVHRVAAQSDHRVATHCAVTLVVHEEHRKIRAWQSGCHQQGAIHVVVTPGLEHKQLAQVVQVLPGVAALGEDRLAEDRWIALVNDADRLAAGVHIEHLDDGISQHERTFPG